MRSVLRSQLSNIRRVARGKPLNQPSFVGTTLEVDDANLFHSLRADHSRWHDDEIVHAFEEEFTNWNGSRHAFAFMGGRVALSACIDALGLQEGDEVIIPGYTCIAVPNAFFYAGVKVVCADIELETYGLDVLAAERAITPKTRAIMLHHLYGLVCRDYEAIVALARRKGLSVIEDCAHATGAKYKGVNVGNLGDVSFFSSELSKVFSTGQGGLAVTNSPDLAVRLRQYWNRALQPDDDRIYSLLATLLNAYAINSHPQRWIMRDIARWLYGNRILISTTAEEERGLKPKHYGQRMPGAIASIGRQQLPKVQAFNTRRRQAAARWDAWCDHTGHKKPLVVNESLPVFLRYPVLADAKWKRDIAKASEHFGSVLGVWFVSNYHPVVAEIAGCPNADLAVSQCINFPTLEG